MFLDLVFNLTLFRGIINIEYHERRINQKAYGYELWTKRLLFDFFIFILDYYGQAYGHDKSALNLQAY